MKIEVMHGSKPGSLRQMLGRCVRAGSPWGLGEDESSSMGSVCNWRRIHRTMSRRGWAQLRVLGESGDALVFLAVRRTPGA